MSSVGTEIVPPAIDSELSAEENHCLRWALRQNGFSIGAHAARVLARYVCRVRPEFDGLEQAMREGPEYPWAQERQDFP